MKFLFTKKFKKAPDSEPDIQHKDLEYAFTDLDGIKHYRTPNVMSLTIPRIGKAWDFKDFMSSGLDEQHLSQLLDVIDVGIATAFDDKTKKEAKWEAAKMAGVAINEIREAPKLIIHTELLIQYLAVFYIREDEPIADYSQHFQDKKVESFKRMINGGSNAAFFLKSPELIRVTNSWKLSDEELNELWKECQTTLQRKKKMLEILLSKAESVKDKRTSSKT